MAHTYKNSKADLTSTSDTVLYKLNTASDESVKVIVRVGVAPASSDTRIDFTIATVELPAVYRVVSFVDVKSNFALVYVCAIFFCMFPKIV